MVIVIVAVLEVVVGCWHRSGSSTNNYGSCDYSNGSRFSRDRAGDSGRGERGSSRRRVIIEVAVVGTPASTAILIRGGVSRSSILNMICSSNSYSSISSNGNGNDNNRRLRDDR